MSLNPFASEFKPSFLGLGLAPLKTSPAIQAPRTVEKGPADTTGRPSVGEPAEPSSLSGAQGETRTSSRLLADAHADGELHEADLYDRPTTSGNSTPQAASSADTHADLPGGTLPAQQTLLGESCRPLGKADSLPLAAASKPLGPVPSDEDFSRRCSLALPNIEPWGRPSTPVPSEDLGSRPSSPDPDLKLGPGDFDLLRVVGQGAFGKVFQVRLKHTGKVYAMKVMRKDRILEKNHGDYIKAERDVLTAVLHPYIVALRYSFQTSTKLYLVLDFVNGGHLFFQLYRQGIFSEELARLYTAEIVLAISHLHSLEFVHRDLKPENVLLDKEGHIKVTDFGLAKANMSAEGRTNSFIGTMEYMAPEIILGMGHGKAVDWWSVGILLYEMLCGMPPFKAKGRQQLQKQITTAKLKLPPYLSGEAQSLVKALLQREAPKRLGWGEDGSAKVMAHPFFRPINWKHLLQQQVKSPFKPSCRSQDSVENFDRVWTDQAPEDSPCSSPVKGLGQGGMGSNIFEGFTYSAPSLLANLPQKPSSLLAS